MVWGKDRCGAACVRGQLYFRRMRVIRTEKMLIENADMIVCANNTQTEPDLRCLGALLGRPRRGWRALPLGGRIVLFGPRDSESAIARSYV